MIEIEVASVIEFIFPHSGQGGLLTTPLASVDQHDGTLVHSADAVAFDNNFFDYVVVNSVGVYRHSWVSTYDLGDGTPRPVIDRALFAIVETKGAP